MGKNKRNRNSGSQTGLTPPNKTKIIMASPNQQQQQQQLNVSQVLNQAHDTLYTSTPHNSSHRSVFIPSQYQQIPLNQTFEYTNPQPLPTPHPSVQVQPGSVPPFDPNPPVDPPYHTYHHPQPQHSFPPPPFPAATDSTRVNITMDMLFSSINSMNQRFERFDFEFNERFSKLDQKLDERFGIIDRNLAGMRQEIDEIKETQKNHNEILKTEEKHHHEISDRMREVENYTQDMEAERYTLKEDFFKLQSHSMKYNLIFGGIPQTETDENEDTEAVIKDFLKTELEIPGADTIQFQNVHRLRKRHDGKPRNIIARFTNYRDHETVRKSVPGKLRLKPQYSVNRQYPSEISDRRKALIPKLKELQRRGIRASLVYDQIMVNGQSYNPTRDDPLNAIHNDRTGYR